MRPGEPRLELGIATETDGLRKRSDVRLKKCVFLTTMDLGNGLGDPRDSPT